MCSLIISSVTLPLLHTKRVDSKDADARRRLQFAMAHQHRCDVLRSIV